MKIKEYIFIGSLISTLFIMFIMFIHAFIIGTSYDNYNQLKNKLLIQTYKCQEISYDQIKVFDKNFDEFMFKNGVSIIGTTYCDKNGSNLTFYDKYQLLKEYQKYIENNKLTF